MIDEEYNNMQEEYYLNEYGCRNPMCGNCKWIRKTDYNLRCLVGHFDKRDFDSVKCIYYKYNPNDIKELTDDELDFGWKIIRDQAIKEYKQKFNII